MRGDAVVVGGGIGGLAVGRALRAAGWRVRIHERAAGLPATGTALGMWPEAMRALDALGRADLVRSRGVAQHGASLLRPDGRVLARGGPREPVRLVGRPELLRALHDDGLEDAVVWDSTVEDPTALEDADLVVGADGIHSRIRPLVTGRPAAPRRLGAVAFRGTVAGPVDSLTETWGRGRLFGITPHDAGTTNWFAAVRADRLARYEGGSDLDVLTRLYGDWHPAVAGLLRRIDPASVDRRTLHEVGPLRSFVRGRTALVGDAAHAMAPNAGRGACEALLDAVALARALRTADSVPAGLRAYDAARRRRAQRVVRISRLLGRVSTAEHLLPVRNALVAGLSPLVPR